jgi:hypothetical protein
MTCIHLLEGEIPGSHGAMTEYCELTGERNPDCDNCDECIEEAAE